MFNSTLLITLILFTSAAVTNTYANPSDSWKEEVKLCQKFNPEFAAEASNTLEKTKLLSQNFKSFTPYPNNTPKCTMSASEDNRGYYCIAACKFSDGEGTYVEITLGEANWRRKNKEDLKRYYDIESVNYISTL